MPASANVSAATTNATTPVAPTALTRLNLRTSALTEPSPVFLLARRLVRREAQNEHTATVGRLAVVLVEAVVHHGDGRHAGGGAARSKGRVDRRTLGDAVTRRR